MFSLDCLSSTPLTQDYVLRAPSGSGEGKWIPRTGKGSLCLLDFKSQVNWQSCPFSDFVQQSWADLCNVVRQIHKSLQCEWQQKYINWSILHHSDVNLAIRDLNFVFSAWSSSEVCPWSCLSNLFDPVGASWALLRIMPYVTSSFVSGGLVWAISYSKGKDILCIRGHTGKTVGK